MRPEILSIVLHGGVAAIRRCRVAAFPVPTPHAKRNPASRQLRMMARSRLIAVLAAASLASTAWGVPVEPRKLAEDCDGESFAADLVEVDLPEVNPVQEPRNRLS